MCVCVCVCVLLGGPRANGWLLRSSRHAFFSKSDEGSCARFVDSMEELLVSSYYLQSSCYLLPDAASEQLDERSNGMLMTCKNQTVCIATIVIAILA